MPIEFGQVLGMIGGSPILKAGKVVIEKLKAAKTTDPGGSGNVLESLLKNGPGSVVRNPMGAVNSLMSTNLQSAVTSLAGNGGASGLLSALGSGNPAAALTSVGGATNLTDAMNQFKSMTGAMSGLTNPGTGQVGLMDMIGHSSVTSGVPNLPANMSLATVMAPLNMQSSVQAMATSLPQMAAAVNAGTQTAAAATTTVQGYTNQINAALAASAAAVSNVQTMGQTVAGVTMMSVALSSPEVLDPSLVTQLKAIINPTGPLAQS
jgi:hypothetical protein